MDVKITTHKETRVIETLKAHVLSNIGVNEFRIPLKEDDDDNSDID